MASNKFWSKWRKPWTKDQCERRYVQGDRLSVRELAGESGVPAKTIERWSAKESWPKLRGEWQSRMREATKEKTIHKASEKLSEDLSAVSLEHFEAYQRSRKIAALYFETLENSLQLIRSTATMEEIMKFFKENSGLSLNFWSLVLDRAVKGERLALGMEYEDANKAYTYLERMGLKIIDPTAEPEDADAEAEGALTP